jgi:hypothetical protein
MSRHNAVAENIDVAAFLAAAAPGFDRLSTDEREAIKDFTLLWSFYEGMILNTVGNADAIIRSVASLNNSGGELDLEPFRPAITYFTQRYFDGSHLIRFKELHLRRNDHPDLVERVVRGQTSDNAEIFSAILIIVLRLRNNLFHGVKWTYGIRGQLENFRHANNVLMAAINLHRQDEFYGF